MHTLESDADHAYALRVFLRACAPRGGRAATPGVLPGEWRNNYGERWTVDQALAQPHRPMAVWLATWTRGRTKKYTLIPGDFDAKQLPLPVVHREAAEFAQLAREAGIEPVVTRSGPTDGRHVWTGCAQGITPELANRIGELGALLWASWDRQPLTNPEQGALRPPGAAHRGGGHSTLLAHTPEQAVAALRPGSPPAAFRTLARRMEALARKRDLMPRQIPAQRRAAPHVAGLEAVPPSITATGPVVRTITRCERDQPRLAGPWRPLGPRTLAKLAEPLARDVDHSRAFHPVLRAAALACWTLDQAAVLVRDAAASPALEWLRSERTETGRRPRTAEETARLLARAWHLAVQDAARTPLRPGEQHGPRHVEEAVADLLRRVQAAGTARWLRESGPVDHRVLTAYSYLAVQVGTLTVSLNVRRIAVLAGCSHTSAARSLHRLAADGWLQQTDAHDLAEGRAARWTLATAHTCTDDPRHRCAVYHLTDKTPDHTGCDRSANARRRPLPPTALNSAQVGDFVRSQVVHQQGDVWAVTGRHAARTHQVVLQARRPLTPAQIARQTGYSAITTLRHLVRLGTLDLVTLTDDGRGLRARAGSGTLHQAAAALGCAGRTADRAVKARVDQEVRAWWQAEVEWCRLPREAKRRRGERPHPAQTVVPGTDPTRRAYPRTSSGKADHAEAWRIEAVRVDAAALHRAALHLAQAGQVIDPPRLTVPAPEQPAPVRRPVILPARHACPHCQAEPGQRCRTWMGELTTDWHHARRRAAGDTRTAAELQAARARRHANRRRTA